VTFIDFFQDNHWNIVQELTTPARSAELLPVDDLPLSTAALAFLHHSYPGGIYRHQKEALQRYLAGENVCLVTGTASGKSLVFQTAAIDLLSRDPNSRVMAIYPMKALGNEQQDRWQNVLNNSGLTSQVGRIDGNVAPGFRAGVLERSQVIVFTPDIIHAWMFSNLSLPAVQQYLRQVRLIVVDEIHAYSGVFGSNAAFLFRRLQHTLNLLNAKPAYICASATIAQPGEHLAKLFGKSFQLVGSEYDTSPRYPLKVHLVEPPGSDRFLDEVVRLLEYLTQHTKSRFIAFVDSRKQVELISSILNRLLKEEKAAAAAAAAAATAPESEVPKRGRGTSRAKKAVPEPSEEDELAGEVTGVLQNLNVLPYRAGYEDHDRRQIQERLAEGTLNGVVSTSALELGIDIPHLDTCVLIGVPASSTSLQQRIGRIGRHGPGDVIVVNGGDVHDQAVFAAPRSFFERPLAESALYLDNEHIQYIHVLCLARQGGEHDQVLAIAGGKSGQPFSSQVEFPAHFMELSQVERDGESPRHLISLKLEARERPNYTFPLRDVESQFKVERRDGPNVSSLGSLSFGQLMREAYPGAIYYYATIPYRVTRVNVKAKNIQVRREKRYTTQPQRTPPAVFPRLNAGGVSGAGQMGQLVSLECNLLVRESIRGVVEQRGRNESIFAYPLPRELGFFQDQPYFNRNFFTTGVLISHPALDAPGLFAEGLASLLYEAFMLMIPFERQDIGSAADRFRVSRLPAIADGHTFLVIYDQTYGSLRLSTRLLDPQMLGRALVEASLLAGRSSTPGAAVTVAALSEMARDVFQNAHVDLVFGGEGAERAAERDHARWERIVVPGSKGLMVRTSEEFQVVRILNTPGGLSYEGTPVSMVGASITVMPLLSDVAEIPGESQVGWYDIVSGEIEALPVDETQVLHPGDATLPAPEIDPDWLARVLATYLHEGAVERLAQVAHSQAPGSEQRVEWLRQLARSYTARGEGLAFLSMALDAHHAEVLDRSQPAIE
jgi:DEAD/DEAH box helicase domain-containing protein